MFGLIVGVCILSVGLSFGPMAASLRAPQQGSQQQDSDQAKAGSGVNPAQVGSARKRTRQRAHETRVVPIESAPNSSAGRVDGVQQRTADQRLLEQQQRQSDQAAQINNQQVRTAQKQRDNLQNEQRIEDAPGPSQTGTVPGRSTGQPGMNSMGTNPNNDVRIQDAPGPSQTLPQNIPAPRNQATPVPQPGSTQTPQR